MTENLITNLMKLLPLEHYPTLAVERGGVLTLKGGQVLDCQIEFWTSCLTLNAWLEMTSLK